MPARIAGMSLRIIPTHVGSTSHYVGCSETTTNHSHACGINVIECSENSFELESFPRMWDQRPQLSRCKQFFRIIPTHVGSTVAVQLYMTWRIESFPRMWDQRLLIQRRAGEVRIIPTHVGSTGLRGGRPRKETNHSHACGINVAPPRTVKTIPESFPRMWDQPYTGLGPCRPRSNHSHACGINTL